MKVLAGDIGGTKALLHIAKVVGNRVESLYRARFDSQAYGDFIAILEAFLDHAPSTLRNDIGAACFGVAGPISGTVPGTRQAHITNLPWRMDEAALKSRLQLPRVDLINDFYAVANGIEALGDDDLATLHAAPAQAQAPRLVVGAGTGLGVAQLFWCEGRYRAHASQGGHIHVAATDPLQAELVAYMQKKFGRVSYERLVSGSGLVHIHAFLAQREQREDSIAAVMDRPDPAAAVTERARAGDDLANRAVALFLRLYGGVTGDLALVTLAYGGIYIAGGIAPKLAAEMGRGDFMAAYGDKGRMTPIVMQMPVYIILRQDAGLLGATLAATGDSSRPL